MSPDYVAALAESGSPRGQIPWSRLGLESVAILGSILLAFAIDAWWDGHQEREREADLISSLAQEFAATRVLLDERVLLAERMATGNDLLLELVSGGNAGSLRSVPDSLIMAVIGGPTFEPGTSSLDAALASGEIELLRSDELRSELATWRRLLEDTAEDEREVRRITNEQVIPELARSLGLGPYFDGLLMWSAAGPGGGSAPLPEAANRTLPGNALVLPTTELEGALALRSFYVGFAATDLAALRESLARITALASR